MRKLSPLQDALLLALGILIIAVILLIDVLFPPRVRGDAPYVYAPVPTIAFTPIPEPARSRIAPEPAGDTQRVTTAPMPSAPVKRASPAPSDSGSVRTAGSALSGIATWYRWRPGQAAAGPALRAALGSGWRGDTVAVCVRTRCVTVRLTDWCACPGGRLVDLDAGSFAALAPLSVGVLRVEVR